MPRGLDAVGHVARGAGVLYGAGLFIGALEPAMHEGRDVQHLLHQPVRAQHLVGRGAFIATDRRGHQPRLARPAGRQHPVERARHELRHRPAFDDHVHLRQIPRQRL